MKKGPTKAPGFWEFMAVGVWGVGSIREVVWIPRSLEAAALGLFWAPISRLTISMASC